MSPEDGLHKGIVHGIPELLVLNQGNILRQIKMAIVNICIVLPTYAYPRICQIGEHHRHRDLVLNSVIRLARCLDG